MAGARHMEQRQVEQHHVGLIGFGAIGRALHAHLSATPGYRLTVLDRSGRRPPETDGSAPTLDALIAARPALVVEAAGQAAVAELVPALLAAGIDVVVASTGALGDPDTLHALTLAAEKGGARLVVPSGAIGGLDYLAALAGVADARIEYTSRKPVAAWDEELRARGQDPATLAGEAVLFEGGAAEAARLYPRNLNAGLTVALAAGPARTRVRVVADPAVAHNTHEIRVESPLGSAELRFSNRPSPDNPKTSALTAHSLAAAVRRHFEPIVI